MSFFWYQQSGGEDPWIEALSQHRAQIIAEKRPAFVTVLDAEDAPNDEWGREQYATLRYTGPLYFDFDGESVDEVIPNFQEFLTKLAGLDVNLKAVRLYATGGRGFHVEVPTPIWCENAPRKGIAVLPYIFKEMAYELIVPTMDMRVYTGRRGRMWRVPNVERMKDGSPTGKFKVSITLDEATAMTPELYSELCSRVRPQIDAEPSAAAFGLASLFERARKKIEGFARSADKAKADVAELARFKGEWPPTVERIMRGEDIAPGMGFQRIAMQLAITANALGKTADQLVEASTELCKNHSGDSTRFNSPRKRKEELRRMWDYTHDNPCYTYSKGGILSLCSVDADNSDLVDDETTGVGHVPDNDEDDEAADAGLPEEVADQLSTADRKLVEGMLVAKGGVYRRTEDGLRSLSNMGFIRPAMMVDAEDGTHLGFEVTLTVDGKKQGRKMLSTRSFTSRAKLSEICANMGATFSGSDTQAGALNVMLSRSAKKKNNMIYVIRKEGLDLIQDPTERSSVKKDVVWASPDGVLSHSSVPYKWSPLISRGPVFNTDIHLAKPLACTPDTVEWLRAVLTMNDPTVIAVMAGWFVSCFHKPFYQELYRQFPLLHPNGSAGSGKTLTTGLFARLFHNTTLPVMPAAGQGSTPFTFKAAWTGTASIPVIVEEYKPAELRQDRVDFLKQHFRLLYNQAQGASGGIDKGTADATWRDVTQYTYSAPCAFLGESQETQTAIVQRSLPVSFITTEAQKRTDSFKVANAGINFMPQLGHLLMRQSMAETLDSRRAVLDPLHRGLRESLDDRVHDRQVYNLAVAVAGLRFMEDTLRAAGFNDELTPLLQRLQGAIYDHKAEINVAVSSEIAKTFDAMSLISRTEAAESEFALREGIEYMVGDGFIEILLKETFVKYYAWCKRKGFQPLFPSTESFIAAASKFSPVTDKFCVGSPLRKTGHSKVFRFSLEKLAEEGVELFEAT